VYSDQVRLLQKLVNKRQTADSLTADNVEKSQVTAVELNIDCMNNFSQETHFLSFNHQIFTVKHTKHYLPGCNSQHSYRLNAVHFTVTTLKTVLQSAMQLVER
jgi:hypothetical protein